MKAVALFTLTLVLLVGLTFAADSIYSDDISPQEQRRRVIAARNRALGKRATGGSDDSETNEKERGRSRFEGKVEEKEEPTKALDRYAMWKQRFAKAAKVEEKDTAKDREREGVVGQEEVKDQASPLRSNKRPVLATEAGSTQGDDEDATATAKPRHRKKTKRHALVATDEPASGSGSGGAPSTEKETARKPFRMRRVTGADDEAPSTRKPLKRQVTDTPYDDDSSTSTDPPPVKKASRKSTRKPLKATTDANDGSSGSGAPGGESSTAASASSASNSNEEDSTNKKSLKRGAKGKKLAEAASEDGEDTSDADPKKIGRTAMRSLNKLVKAAYRKHWNSEEKKDGSKGGGAAPKKKKVLPPRRKGKKVSKLKCPPNGGKCDIEFEEVL